MNIFLLSIADSTLRGLYSAIYVNDSTAARGLPSTVILSLVGSAFWLRVATCPLTLTRPAEMNSSLARREPYPACASIFCNRSGFVQNYYSAEVGESNTELIMYPPPGMELDESLSRWS